MKCPDLVADDLSGFWGSSKPGDRDAGYPARAHPSGPHRRAARWPHRRRSAKTHGRPFSSTAAGHSKHEILRYLKLSLRVPLFAIVTFYIILLLNCQYAGRTVTLRC